MSEGGGQESAARRAVRRSFRPAGPRYWVLVGVLTALVALGVVAWAMQLRHGMSVAGYNDQSFWAVYIANVVTFIGVSYGGAVISAILRLTGSAWRAPLTRLAEGTALVTVVIGGLMIIPHLGYPARIWEMVTRPNLSSPVFWDFVAIMTYGAATLVFFTLPLIPDMAALSAGEGTGLRRRRSLYRALSRGWEGSARQRRVLGGALGVMSILIIPLAVSVHSVLSWAFSLMSRPWWHESIWAPYFVVAALYSGVALVILVVAAYRRAYHLESLITDRHFTRLGYLLVVLGATYLYLTFADILPGGYVGEHSTSAVFHAILVGPYALWFWLFVVAGGIIPILLVAIPRTRNAKGMVVAAVLIVPAMWIKRMVMVLAPANYDRINDIFGTYRFTWVSVAITVAAAAAIPLFLMLLFRLVPMLDVTEIESLQSGSGEGEDVSPETSVPADSASTASASVASRNRWRPRRPWLAVAVVTIALGAAGMGAATQAHADEGDGHRVQITATAEGSTVRLRARLTDSQGRPVSGETVTFSQDTTTFGTRATDMSIGNVSTGTDGVAELEYQSTTSGQQTFNANVGADAETAIRSSVKLDVKEAKSAYRPSPAQPLASVGNTTIIVLLVIVAAVWITLIWQVVRVVRVLRA